MVEIPVEVFWLLSALSGVPITLFIVFLLRSLQDSLHE